MKNVIKPFKFIDQEINIDSKNERKEFFRLSLDLKAVKFDISLRKKRK